ncbi:MAG: L,D-transpeptidase [Actinomycetota bacterium]|nr:L,D-transpeptidase [Actinomycetota bacterium]
MRRSLLALLLLASVVATPAGAQTLPPQEPRIANGVTIARIPVGGMTADEARAAVQTAFNFPLPFVHGKRTWSVKPSTLGSYPYLEPSIAAALVAQPGQLVRLRVKIHDGKIRRYVAYLDRTFSRRARDARLLLRNLRPYITKARPGLQMKTRGMERAIRTALVRTDRAPIPLLADSVAPSVTRASYGSVIVIRRGSRAIYLYVGTRFVRRFRIAVGMPAYPTPLGRFRVVMRERHPTWDPPNSPWAAGLGPVPPGPGNPLGTRWIGTSAPGIGIHGTPQPWTVGTAASHGCIRMYMREVEWLFERVRIGTPVFIVRA